MHKKTYMNRLIIILILYLVCVSDLAIAQVGIGTTNPNKSSILDITSQDKGILIPRSDTLAITNPAKGLIICDSTTRRGLDYYYYDGKYWKSLGSNAAGFLDSFNGNRIIKRQNWGSISGINVATKTNIVDFINAVFFPFISATIDINGSLLFEIGTTNSVNISGTTTVWDETVFSGGHIDKIYTGAPTTIYNFGSATTYSTNVIFSPTQVVSTQDAWYRAYQTVGNNGVPPFSINSGVKYVQSCYPYFYGISTANLTTGGTALYTGLVGKSISIKNNKSFDLVPTGSFGYIYFCYPQSYGVLTDIIDPNVFHMFGSFTRYSANVTSTGLPNNWTEPYYIYKLQTQTSPTAGLYQFIY